MKHFLTLMVLGVFLLGACQQLTPHKQEADHSDSLHYFSIPGFIQSQIMDVDLHNYQINLSETINGKATKKMIDKEQFKQLANQFYLSQFEENSFEKAFEEQIFQDQGTSSLILHYQPKNSNSIQFIDILLDANSNLVKRIFFRENKDSNTVAITKQYSWKRDKEFQINASSVSPQGDSSISYLHVSWKAINQNP